MKKITLKKEFLFFVLLSVLVSCGGEDEDIVPGVKTINFETPAISIVVGDTKQLKINHAPADLQAPEYEWTSENTDVASVDKTGKVTTSAVGTATIKVKAKGLSLETSCTVTVTPRMATGIQLSKSVLELKIGENDSLTYTILPENTTEKKVNWNSDKPGIATVKEGKIVAVSVGTATITAKTNNGMAGTCKVTVKPVSATSLKISKSTLSINPNERHTLSVTFEPENTTNQKVNWTSDNPQIAIVSNAGVVTGINIGSATITATSADGAVKATCKVTVDPFEATAITLSKSELSMEQSSKFTLTATITPQNVTNKKINWSSNTPQVATVSEEGEVTATGIGNAVITATSGDGKQTATCKVEVILKGLTLSRSSANVLLGETIKLSVYNAADNSAYKEVDWSSSAPGIASVMGTSGTNEATVTTKATGTATITVSSADGSKKAECLVTVKQVEDLITLRSSGSIISINGYLSGSVYSHITNTLPDNIELTSFGIYNGMTWGYIAGVTDPGKLGTLKPGNSTNLGATIQNIYNPIFRWTFMYKGKSYTVEHRYSNKN